jgi:hypothetical protein
MTADRAAYIRHSSVPRHPRTPIDFFDEKRLPHWNYRFAFIQEWWVRDAFPNRKCFEGLVADILAFRHGPWMESGVTAKNAGIAYGFNNVSPKSSIS